MLNIEQIAQKVNTLRRRNHVRDGRMRDVRDIRQGDCSRVLPGMFPDNWPKPIVANFIDVTARDLAEVIAPMPSINCTSGNMSSDRAKKFAAKRTKVAQYYPQHSELPIKMVSAVDRYLSYGFQPFLVYPDFDAQCPVICPEDPFGCYAEFDLKGRCNTFVKVWREFAHELAAKFPEHEAAILGDDWRVSKESLLEVVKFMDGDQITLYLPERKNRILNQSKNWLGRCPVVVANRPGLEADPRGQFDDVAWVQLARARMALLGLEAAEKSVQAPLALPADVQQMAFGADGIMRSNSPEKIRRVGIELPQGAFVESELLQKELQIGARYPEGRTGNIDASVITGRGVQSMLGGFDTQIKTAQLVFGETLKHVIEMCFEMDEKLWPDTRKEIRGTANGTPFEESYIPSRDIAGNHQVDISYGFAAGMDPNRALVFLLQLRGDHLLPRDFVQRQLPMDVDVVQLQQQIDIEEVNDALKQGLFATLQSMGIMAQQGMDPTMLLHQAASIIEAREKGKPFHEAVLAAFAPPKTQPPGELTPEAETSPETPGETSSPVGLPPGMAGAMQAPQGGPPDLQTLIAGLTAGGKPALSASINRRIPA